MSILVNVVNQKMYVSSNADGLVAGSQQFVQFKFNLSSEWDGLMTFAQFRQGTEAYNQYLDEDNCVYLPAEIGVGTCTLMLYGSHDTTIGTTNYLTLKIGPNNLVADAESTDISESLYNQLVTKINALTSWNGQSVGQATNNGGEIFNDYEANQALAPYTKSDGTGSRAGSYGYHTLATTADGTITVDDASLTGNRAIDNYAVGDALCFDGQKHWYHELKISALSTNSDGNTVITVATVDGRDMVDLTMDGSGDDLEDWVYVPTKPTAGISGPFSYAAYAGGEGSVAIGRGARATGRGSQAIGNYATAIGRNSVAGYTAYAEGNSTVATGLYSHAEGSRSKATGTHSHAEGDTTTASGTASHAEGCVSKAIGDYSHAEGGSKAEGAYSHAEGNTTTASGAASHAEGGKSVASGSYSHTEGRETVASGLYSHAEGYLTEANSKASHAEGSCSKAEGEYSHAEGYSNTASGAASHAEGFTNTASGSYSHAEGYVTVASGKFSHAEGSNTIATGPSQHVQGKYNVEDTEGKYAHIVGGGTSKDNRKNIHTVDWDGNAFYSGSMEVSAVILKSTTPGSTKKFMLTIDDSGVLAIAEV